MSIPESRRRDAPRDAVIPIASSRPDGLHVVPASAPPRKRHEKNAPVLSEELFSNLLVRERKRSDRSNRPFILLSLTTRNHLDLESSRIGQAVLQALAYATRET